MEKTARTSVKLSMWGTASPVIFSGVEASLTEYFPLFTQGIIMGELHLRYICNRLEEVTLVNALKDVLYQGFLNCILRNASNLWI